MTYFIFGFLAGLVLGSALYRFSKKKATDGVIRFNPLGDEILGLSLDHDLYSLSKKKELRITVQTVNIKEALNGDYLERLEEDLNNHR